MKKFLIIIGCTILYFASIVPVGLFLYSLKTDMGFNIFKTTGLHGFMYCIQSEGKKALEENKSDDQY